MTTTPDQVVRAYFDAYSSGDPVRFETCVSPDYVDYGHTPPGRGVKGAQDDLAQAIAKVGGPVRYDVDATVTRDDVVAAAWTGHLPNGATSRGLSLYVVTDGLVAEVRHAAIGALPS